MTTERHIRHNMWAAALCVIILLLVNVRLSAQDSLPPPSGMDGLNADMMEAQQDPLNKMQDSLRKVFNIERIKGDIATERYYQQSVSHRRNTFQWQYTSGQLIFILVIVTVLCGLVYSGIQFFNSIAEIKLRGQVLLRQEENKKLALQAALAGKTVPANDPGTDAVATKTGSGGVELEMSMSSIKITSSLVGIVVLVISIAFFFLYLQFIYPIEKFRVDTEAKRSGIYTDTTGK